MQSGQLSPIDFVAKWSRVELSERAASHEHFLDLCRMLGQPTPAQHDATGAEYTFEKGVTVTGSASIGSRGDFGFADVWWRGKFAWEYKRRGKYKDLTEAYRQLCQYREALENPPLLVVSDIETTEIHTNFTGTAKQVHTIKLDDLAEPKALDLLRRVFTDPLSFKPTLTPEKVTEDVAKEFAALARRMRDRGHDPHVAAHFLMKCMFCLFAEDVGLLPNKLFNRLLESRRTNLASLTAGLTDLFDKMRTGGAFGVDDIAHFNGGLFDDSPALPLTPADVETLLSAAKADWGNVEPAVFGTLFERSLDPNTRAQIGAHYTSRDDIMLIVEPVILAPLRREWEAVKADVEKQLERRRSAKTPKARKSAEQVIEKSLLEFVTRLASVRILDPACGSGNFLYVAIQQLLNLEKEVITFAARPDIAVGMFPRVRPTQLFGIEINPYAAELAQVVIWIGYLQWMRDNGFITGIRIPILEPLQTIECRDAILDFLPLRAEKAQDKTRPEGPKDHSQGHEHMESGTTRPEGPKDRSHGRKPVESGDMNKSAPEGRQSADAPARTPVPAQWPEADFIIGNPPFLGSRLARNALGDSYVDQYQSAYSEDIPEGADFCCYWFELSRRAMRSHTSCRIGLLATQGIRGGSSRRVLEKIAEEGTIFFAVSDREWPLEGALVHVSLVGFSRSTNDTCVLDGRPVPKINANLTAGVDLVSATQLSENKGISFQGTINSGEFDISQNIAARLLRTPCVDKRTNSFVLRPWANGKDITGRARGQWIIDFGINMAQEEAAGFDAPFEHVQNAVKPQRDKTKYAPSSSYPYWQLWNPRPDMRKRLSGIAHPIATPRVTKHRLFVRLNVRVLPDAQIIVFARSDDYFFGVLHSAIHELWARRLGTQLREAESGFRYTPTTCFETFPLPWPPGSEPQAPARGTAPVGRAQGSDDGAVLVTRISEAARELNEQRERWLNPPEWIEPIAKLIDASDDFSDLPEEARPLIRQSAIMAAAAADRRLKKRTLTNLYNERPTWLRLVHEKLDRAVLAAYAAVDPDGDWSEDWAEVWTETGAGQGLPHPQDAGAKPHPLAAHRAETDQKVLANLLRLNLARSHTK